MTCDARQSVRPAQPSSAASDLADHLVSSRKEHRFRVSAERESLSFRKVRDDLTVVDLVAVHRVQALADHVRGRLSISICHEVGAIFVILWVIRDRTMFFVVL